MPLRVIFLDLNSYFASVEQAERPELIDKPIAVVPTLVDTTCCLAASYPAKAKGIQTGTLVRDARRLCPGIVFIAADHRKYVDYHHRIIAAVEKCLPVWKVCSIDEMAIQLFGRERELNFAYAKALEIKERLRTDVHPSLTCSIGIAPNRYIAKIASDMQKPNGLVIIPSEDLPQRLYHLQLRDFPGIGPRMEKHLLAAGCTSASQLCQKTPAQLKRLWGKHGLDFWRLIHGEEVEPAEAKESIPGSISHSRVLPPAERNADCAWSTLVSLLSLAAMRLREEGLCTRSLQLRVKLMNTRHQNQEDNHINHWDDHVHFAETQDSLRLLEELEQLWQRAPHEGILYVAVSLSALSAMAGPQLSLFHEKQNTELMAALDKLNKTHRKNLVVFGSSSDLKHSSQAPIAFSHIPKDYE